MRHSRKELAPLSRKAQIPLGEVVLVLIVFFVIVTASGMVYMRVSSRNAAEKINAEAYLALAETTKSVTDLPELRFGLASREDVTTIDVERRNALIRVLDTTSLTADSAFTGHYREQFAGYKVEINCLYPAEWCDEIGAYNPLFDYTSPEAQNFLQNKLPVLLYNPLTRHQAYGVLVVTQAS